MSREKRAKAIKIICEKCGCSDEEKDRHFEQYVFRNWQPHASLRFKAWWFKQPEFLTSKDTDGNGINPVDAQNVARIWDAYLQDKEVGLA